MPNVFTASDLVIGPVVAALGEIIQTQIVPPPDKVYLLPPAKAPEDNTATIVLGQYKVLDDTCGKLEMRIVFVVTHWFRATPDFATACQKAYNYLMPYVLAFSDHENQETDNWRIVQVSQGGVKTMGAAGEQRVGLTTNVEIITEFNVPI